MHIKITYRDGRVEEKSGSVGWEKPGFSSGIESITETDKFGNTRTTSESVLFPGNNVTYTGFTFHEEGVSLEDLAVGVGMALLPVALAGAVVYGAGKLIYHVATIEKRRREEEMFHDRMIQYYKEWFDEKVERILNVNNQKLSDYKELFDLGVITEQEYDSHVRYFVEQSNKELDEERAKLQRRIEEENSKRRKK